VLGVSSQDLTGYFTLAAAANRSSPWCLLTGPNRLKLLKPIPPTGLVAGYGDMAGKLWTKPSPLKT